MGNGQTLEMASLEWTFVFAFLALEVGCVLLLCIPWPQAFHKYIVRGVTCFVGGKLMTTIKWSFGIVFVLCVDAVRQVYFKYDAMHLEHDEKHEHRGGGLSANLYEKSGKFRAERNMYLALFVLVLGLVLNRLIQLMAEGATMKDRLEAMTAQAQRQQESMKNPELLRALLEAAEAEAAPKNWAKKKAPAEGSNPDPADLPSPPAPGGADTGLRQRASKKVD